MLTVRAMNESMQLTICEPSDQKFVAVPDYAALKLALSGLTGSDADLKLEGDRLTVTARGKRTINRWVTAAALAALVTMVFMGGLHWLRLIGT
jgi:hypothetical protein